MIFYYFKKGKKATETQKKIGVVYGKGAVTAQICQKWSVEFVGTVDQVSLCCGGCLMHWKMFSRTPSLYPLEANSDVFIISKSIKSLVKIKNVFYGKKHNELFGQPNNL